MSLLPDICPSCNQQISICKCLLTRTEFLEATHHIYRKAKDMQGYTYLKQLCKDCCCDVGEVMHRFRESEFWSRDWEMIPDFGNLSNLEYQINEINRYMLKKGASNVLSYRDINIYILSLNAYKINTSIETTSLIPSLNQRGILKHAFWQYIIGEPHTDTLCCVLGFRRVVIDKLLQKLHISRHQIRKYLDALIAHGWIERHTRTQQSNIQKRATYLKFTEKFYVEVLLSKSEDD